MRLNVPLLGLFAHAAEESWTLHLQVTVGKSPSSHNMAHISQNSVQKATVLRASPP